MGASQLDSPGRLLEPPLLLRQRSPRPARSGDAFLVRRLLPLAVLVCSVLLAAHNDLLSCAAPLLRRWTLPLPSNPLSGALDLPTIHVVYPPPELEQRLAQCVGYCAGTPAAEDAVAERLLAFEDRDDAFLLASQKAYGPPLPIADLYPRHWPFVLRQTDQFALGDIISLRMRALASSQTPPANSSSADFIFLSLDTFGIARCLRSCQHAYALPRSFDRNALNQSITDWLVATVEDHRGRRAYPSIVFSLSLIDHDYEENLLAEDVQEAIKNDVVVLGIERQPWQTVDKLATFLQVPYPSTMHLPLRASQGSDLGDWQLAQDRPCLISFGGKRVPSSPTSGQGPFNGFPLRTHLSTSLLSPLPSSPPLCIQIFSPRSPPTQIATLHLAMSHSTFCLQPPGDSPTRKGFWDSVLLGCIPVVFRRGTYSRIFEGGLGGEVEEMVAMVIEEKEVLEGRVDVVEWLSGVGEEEVRRKRVAIAKLAERMQYGVPEDVESLRRAGWTSDAFGGVLKQLALIKKRGE